MRHRPLLLLVEDDRVLRELYRVALTLSDFDVHACEDGLEALRFLDQQRPDVIVLDLNLPRMPGKSLYDDVRARPQTRYVPIIVVTGADTIPPLDTAMVLRKPVTGDRLTHFVELSLQRHKRSWLFRKGTTSVRMTLLADPGERVRLMVEGPGAAENTYEHERLTDAAQLQTELQRQLLAEGYRHLVVDRRKSSTPRPSGPDRRRRRT